jgi:hypothetical protein
VTSDIGEDTGMDDGTKDPGQGETGAWRNAWADAVAELMGTYARTGVSDSAQKSAEPVMDGLPWHLVSAGELAGVLAVYQQANALAGELRAALALVGISAGEVPELCGGVDGQGRAVVRIGEVSAVTGARLTRVLRGAPIPPAARGKAA